MQEENTAPPNALRQREVLQMVNLSPSLRCLFLIAALLCLPHSALALPAIEEQFIFICGDVGCSVSNTRTLRLQERLSIS
jgi:hypothetical protein